ncbi:MAG: hypothetical protein Q4Q04_07075 [Methanocorpusculum sp.]|nr:hypothetical protein [Methanocorpusculum sp.]
MKKTDIIFLCLAAAAVVFAAGCIAPTPTGNQTVSETLNYSTAIIGDWKSTGLYNNSQGVEFSMLYHFNANNTGTLSADTDGTNLQSVDIYWGNVEKNAYIVGYTTTSKGDYLYLADDGKSLVNEFGETFTKVK